MCLMTLTALVQITIYTFISKPSQQYGPPTKNNELFTKGSSSNQSILVEKGYSVTVRTTRGSDIQAACGQLVGRVSDRTNRQAKYGEISLVNEKDFK